MSPKITTPTAYQIKAEFFGRPNTGKSTCAYSICKIKPLFPTKTEIHVFTNEATYADTLALFPKEEPNFTIWQHRTLEEFEADWVKFCEEKHIGTIAGTAMQDVSEVSKTVHAIIIDEGEFIYREGYVARHAQDLVKKAIDFLPKDFGVPRSWFVGKMNQLASLPCHFILNSKVGAEYESVRYTRKDGKPGALQFLKTGRDTYRLPDNVLYLPNFSMHLFFHDEPEMIDVPVENPNTGIKEMKTMQNLDQFDQPIFKRTFHGTARKQKVDREKEFVIPNPTMSKIFLKLASMRRNVKIK